MMDQLLLPAALAVIGLGVFVAIRAFWLWYSGMRKLHDLMAELINEIREMRVDQRLATRRTEKTQA
jgi:hypothetical protein